MEAQTHSDMSRCQRSDSDLAAEPDDHRRVGIDVAGVNNLQVGREKEMVRDREVIEHLDAGAA